MRKLKAYYLESYGCWFIVMAYTKRDALHEAKEEWGRGSLKTVRKATDSEIEYYKNLKGDISKA